MTALELSITEPVTTPVVSWAKADGQRAATMMRVSTLPSIHTLRSEFIVSFLRGPLRPAFHKFVDEIVGDSNLRLGKGIRVVN